LFSFFGINLPYLCLTVLLQHPVMNSMWSGQKLC
jgi:hypothetical protein